MHFATSYRARQVYNNELYSGGKLQVHCGRPGLKMLSYNCLDEVQMCMFDDNARAATRTALMEDIPALVADSGNAMSLMDFYASVYNETPAHSDDIHDAMIECPDVEVITETGGVRRSGKAIKPTDIVKLQSQLRFVFGFPEGPGS